MIVSRKLAVALGVAVTLAGCGAGGSFQHHAVWSADDESTFLASCRHGQTGSFCDCALQSVKAQYPRPSALPGGQGTSDEVNDDAAGQTAAQNPGDFPGC